MSELVEDAYLRLFAKEPGFSSEIIYSRAFKGYNAKVKYTKSHMEFRLSYQWKEVSEDMQIGLIQSLLNKVNRTKINTVEQELYDIFMRKLQDYAPKDKTEPVLEDSFIRVNNSYFSGMIEKPNLEFGGESFRTLGTYDHSTDTIRISNVLVKDETLLDYVMYHEMLHKKLRYKNSGGRTIHHSRQFREEEKKFIPVDVEKRLKEFLRKEKLRKRFWFL